MSDGLGAWRIERAAQVEALGPRPKWYRPFARRRWMASWRQIHAVEISHSNLLLRQMYPAAAVMAERSHPALSMFQKARTP